MKFSLKKVLTAATALVASVGMAVSGVAVANAAGGDLSITINSSTSLADRTFDVYEPIQITGTAGEKTETQDNRSYTLKVKDSWLPVINSAEVDAADHTKQLTGAQFQVLGTDNGTDYSALHFDRIDDNTFAYNPAGTVTDITTNGHKVQFKGLNAGTYKLHELKAPAGYRVLGSDITVTVVNKTATDAAWTHTDHAETDDNGYQPISYTVNSQEGATDAAVVAVPNSKGFLPQTGGTGIIVLVAAGFSYSPPARCCSVASARATPADALAPFSDSMNQASHQSL